MSYLQLFLPFWLCLTVGGVLVWRGRRPRLLALSAVGLFLWCWPPAAWLALRPLEGRYPMKPPEQADAGAIVVLSGSVFPPFPPRPSSVLGTDSYERCWYAAWVYKNWRPLPVLASGGATSTDPATPPYSRTMAEALRREGVPDGMIWTETRSSSTYENALYSAEILRSKGIRKIVLVTEGYHMLRSELCFRKQGVEVIPAACGFRTYSGPHAWVLLPSWVAAAWNEETLHEVGGLLWYWMRGRI